MSLSLYDPLHPVADHWCSAAGADPSDLIVGEIDDDEADYSFDDWALVKSSAGWTLYSTGGYSCPSQEENASKEIGPAPLADVRLHIENGDYSGYTLPKKQAEQFAELFRHAEKFS